MVEHITVSEDSVIQFVYGFALILIAIVIGFALLGNELVLTAAVVLLLIKDGLPNFIIGGKRLILGEKNE